MKIGKLLCCCLMGIIVFANTAVGVEKTVRFDLDVTALQERGQLKQLKYFKSQNTIKLNDRYHIEDDAPGNGPPEGFDHKERAWFEKLYKGIKIRKDLILDDPRAFSGYIVFDGVEHENNDFPLHISVNEHHFLRMPIKIRTSLIRALLHSG